MIRGVIFDFDGTLTELTLDFPDMRKELGRLVVRYVSPQVMREFDGLLMLELIYAMEKKLGERGTAFRSEAFELLRDIEIKTADGKKVYPYTREVLRSLRQMGLKLGVMTRNSGGAVRKVFPDISEYTDVMVTREDVPVVKPDPSHPRVILDRLGVAPSEALLVGDHPTDVAAGLAVGAETVGVLSGWATRTDMENAQTNHIVDDIRQVPVIVRRRNKDAQDLGKEVTGEV